jgi:hypothetical protein
MSGRREDVSRWMTREFGTDAMMALIRGEDVDSLGARWMCFILEKSLYGNRIDRGRDRDSGRTPRA